MAATFSFDIVSQVDLQEVDNAVNQALKEISQRYDFKNSKAGIDFNKGEKTITFTADDAYKLRALKEIMSARFTSRRISPRALAYKAEETALGGTIRQLANIAVGVEKDKAKELVQLIKKLDLRVQVQIEGEKLRVSSAKKDDLQTVINYIHNLDFPLPLQCINYR